MWETLPDWIAKDMFHEFEQVSEVSLGTEYFLQVCNNDEMTFSVMKYLVDLKGIKHYR